MAASTRAMLGRADNKVATHPDDGVLAIDCKGLERSYGTGAKKSYILRQMDLSLGVGKIYGLLGASGCGKTTFLKCLLGRLAIHGGTLNVFGKPPGAPGHDVPGRDVGFMPQETALYMQFSIHEVLAYYAKLHGLTEEFFQERKKFLMDFLELPDEDRLCINLSGGQQRRVSLCIALLHNPRLVILDEPTVGVDPLLRSRIWEYLVQIAAGGTSIIITTHYIEEARQANTVGLMRDGKLLDEGQPEYLMKKYGKASLEETFLLLCHIQEREKSGLAPLPGTPHRALPPSIPSSPSSSGRRGGGNTTTGGRRDSSGSLHSDDFSQPLMPVASHSSRAVQNIDEAPRDASPGCCAEYGPRGRMVTAELYKGFNRMRRNVAFIFFQFLIPSFQVTLFCLAIGKSPTDLGIGIVNHECLIQPCSDSLLSVKMNHAFDPVGFNMNYYESVDAANNAVKHGKSWGVVQYPSNFSVDLALRYSIANPSEEIIKGSQIYVKLDMSNQQISAFIISGISNAFAQMAATITSNAVPPVVLDKEPFYGVPNPKFTDFIAPGMIISISFAQAIGATAVVFVMDKKGGTMDRTWAAGVRPSEIMASQLVLQIFTLSVQILLLLLVALVGFELPMKGSLPIVFVLAILLGMSGMLAGLVISAVCDEEQAAMQLALGSFFPMLLLSGVIWPVEAIPMGIRYFSYALPTTWAASSMRSIMSRGWGLDQFDVWIGFAVVGGWIVLLFLSAVRGLKSKTP